MSNIQKIKEHFLVIQLEQLITIKKELLHTKRICDYFSVNKDPYADIYRYNLIRVKIFLEDINTIKNEAINLEKIEKAHEFLIHIAKLQKKITIILNGLKLLKDSTRQHSEEAFNQYIPKADLGRRYSSKAISSFIRSYMEEVLDYCDKDKNTKALIVWTFRNEFQSQEKINPRAIETPYFYYDLPYFIPNIFHELNHIASDISNPSQLFQPYKDLKSKIMGVFKNIKDDNEFIINAGLAEEITSDIFAYDLLGPSYLFSCFYSIIYSGMDNLFLENSNSSIPRLISLGINDDSKDSDKDAFAHVVEIQLRLMVLVSYSVGDNFNYSDTIQNNIYGLEEFIGNIFGTKTAKSSLYNSYIQGKIDHGNRGIDNYQSFINLVSKLNKSVQAIIENFKLHDEIKINSKINYKHIFVNIWEEKLKNSNVVFHRSSLREELLRQIFPEDIAKELLFESYELTFFKLRNITDAEQQIKTYFNEQTGAKFKAECDYEVHKSFGIYNNLAIRKKSKTIDKDIVQNFLDDTPLTDLEFYTYKIAMIKLSEDSNNNCSSGKHCAIFQIQLKNQKSETISGAYDSIVNNFKTKIGRCQFEIYKVLGPNDYLVNIKNTTLKTIFDIKKDFSTENEFFRRTFTTIYTKTIDTTSLDTSFAQVSKIRLKGDIKISDLSILQINNKKMSEYCSRILYTSGSMDLEIEWKINTDINPIIDNISNMISDIQTDYKLIIQ